MSYRSRGAFRSAEGLESQGAVVLAVRGRRVTLLCPGGAVRRARLSFGGLRPGDLVDLPAVLDTARPWARGYPRVLAAVAAGLAVAVAVTMTTMFFNPLPAVAMISVDMNPSVNLWVNSVLRVVSAQALDLEGASLLEQVPPARQTLAQYLTALAERSGSVTLAPGAEPPGWLVVAATPLDPGRPLDEGFLQAIEAARDKAASKLRPADPGSASGSPGATPAPLPGATILVPPAMADEAARVGLSAGRYALVVAAQASGADVRASEARGGLLGLIRSSGLDPEALLERACAGDELLDAWARHRERIGTDKGAAGGGHGLEGPGQGQGGASGGQTPAGGGGSQGGGGGPQGGGGGPQGGGESAPKFPVVKRTGSAGAKGRAAEVLDRVGRALRGRSGAVLSRPKKP